MRPSDWAETLGMKDEEEGGISWAMTGPAGFIAVIDAEGQQKASECTMQVGDGIVTMAITRPQACAGGPSRQLIGSAWQGYVGV